MRSFTIYTLLQILLRCQSMERPRKKMLSAHKILIGRLEGKKTTLGYRRGLEGNI